MVAVVIGARGTIGQAVAEEFLRQGHEVVAGDLVAPDISGASGRAVDVTDRESVDSLIRSIEDRNPITALVYAAGVNTTGPVDSIDWSDYDRLMAVNLQGAFHVGASLQRQMRAHPRQAGMVFISSTAGLTGEAGGSVYVATKFGLRGFVESFAAEIAALGGRANTVCPGNVDSVMLTRLAEKFAEREGRSAQDLLDDLAASSAFNRLITPAEVAATCVWLCSGLASGISGQTIVVDGPPA
jgi:NAD(P)-dependent dehydrogenase (short-subunit alcohol dehydrogenase family)